MTNLSDYLKSGAIVFPTIEAFAGSELLSIWQLAEPSAMDIMLDQGYGDRTLFSKIVKNDDDFHAKTIVTMYKDKWIKVLEFNSLDIPLGAYNSRLLKETTKEDIKNTGNQNTVEKVSAFNSDDLIDNVGTASDNVNDSDGLKVRDLTDSNININTTLNNLTEYQKATIINVVLADVAGYYTISIY